jgi:L-threonylcarbamoyladenylate synthase
VIPEHIIDLVRDLQAIVYPTSTLPGLGCLPVSSALDNLFKIKKRPEEMPVSLGVASLDQAKSLVVIPDKALALQKNFPLGTITLVLPSCDADLDYRLGRTHIAIRVFSHPIACELARRVGPIVATSANISGVETEIDCKKAAIRLLLPENYCVSGLCSGGLGSTFIKIDNKEGDGELEATVIREGIIPIEDVNEWWTNPT